MSGVSFRSSVRVTWLGRACSRVQRAQKKTHTHTNHGASHSGLRKHSVRQMVQRTGRGCGGTYGLGVQQRENRGLGRGPHGVANNHGCWRRSDENLRRHSKTPQLDDEINGPICASNTGRRTQEPTRCLGSTGTRETKIGSSNRQRRRRANSSRRRKTGRNDSRRRILRIRNDTSRTKNGPIAEPNEKPRATRQTRESQR